jgi:glutamate-1-semialdehyde 2,1-aminomutase
LAKGLTAAAQEAGVVFCADSVGGMFGLYFSATPPNNYAEMMAGDRERFNAFFHAMLDEGVYFAPAAFEAGFVSAQHSDEVIDETIAAAARVFKKLAA